MAEGRTVKKKILQGSIEVDPNEIAIKVHYEIESTVLSDLLEPVHIERKPHSTKIKLKALTASSNISKLADDVVRKCKYIHPSKVTLVEQLLSELQHRQIREDLSNEATREKESSRRSQRKDLYSDDLYAERGEVDSEEANMENLDDYLEMLYGGDGKEDMEAKTKGTALILQLCHYVGFLEHLIQNHTLMGALSRVLNEEYKKSMPLSYNIMRIFLAFSNFMEMHGILANYKVGNMTMKVIELEITRAKMREEERRKKLVEREKRVRAVRDNQDDAAMEREKEKMAMKTQRDDAKNLLVMKRQEKLLFVCFHVLINLAEDPVTEKKMVKRNLSSSLTTLLDRTSANLLALVVTFLKKLSIFQENKDQMVELDTVSKLVKFIPCSCEPLIHMALRLLFNMSFDAKAREQMVNSALFPKLVELLKKPPYRGRILRLLYHLSVDDRCKSMFPYTEAIAIILQLIINFPQNIVAKELISLGINLSLNVRNAELICQGRGLQHLMERVLHTKDYLLMKMIRNLSMWTYNLQEECTDPKKEYRQRGLWAHHVRPIVKMSRETENQDLLVEALGTLGNFTTLDLPKGYSWADIMEEYQLSSFIPKLLVPGMTQNDVVLEIVIFVGILATDKKAAHVMASSNTIQSLNQVWRENGDDSEIALQLLYTFYQLLQHESTRNVILYEVEERPINNMLQALGSRHNETQVMADRCLDLVLEFDRDEEGNLGELGQMVRKNRFEAFNREWLEAMEQEEFQREHDVHNLEGSYKYPENGEFDDSIDEGAIDPRMLMDYGNFHERVAMDMNMLYTDQGQQILDPGMLSPESTEEYDGYHAGNENRWR